jgi:NADH-quinone oxidoreductase subunit G
LTDTQPRTETPTELSVTLDGKTIVARPGELLIAAAERAGTYIPRFCWHPRMQPVGMCRVCLVEIEGPRGMALQPACMVPCTDGMNVLTESDTVKKAQDGVLEFLLINHPLDCPVCDRGGECPLQDQTLAYGPGESRFVEEKRHWAKPIPISELVLLDRERCIQCARCTRFAEEIAGDPLIQFGERGNSTEIITFPDDPFTSYFSGNTVQICPVGALTARPYRFRARPWDLDQTESTCTTCSVGCRMALQSSSDRLIRHLGIDIDPVNQGWLCDKGRFSHEAVNSDDRLLQPLVRDGDALRDAAWNEALGRVADALRGARDTHGPASIAVLGGARLTNEDSYAWSKLARTVLGTDNVDCQLADGLPADVVLGLPRATIDDACRAGAVVLLGPDIKEELPVLYLRLRQAAVEKGLRLVEITPQATGLTRFAAASLGYRPGEVAVVARALVDGGEPAEAGGVAAADIAAARAALAGVDDVVVVLGRASVAESAASVADAIGALVDAVPNARVLPALRRGNVHGALDMGLAPGLLPGRVSASTGREWFGQEWGSFPDEQGLDATAILQAAAEGRVQGLVLLGADLLTDFPDRALARRALTGAGFVVALDTFLSATAREADVVLPVSTFGERAGTTTNLEGRVSRLTQKITPPGTARSDWMIAAELASRLGGDLGFRTHSEITAEIARMAPSHIGLTPALLGRPGYRDGVVAPLGTAPPASAPDLPSAVPVEVDAAALLAPPESETVASDEAATSVPPVDVPAEPSAEVPSLLTWTERPQPAAPPQIDAYALRLVSGRLLYDLGAIVQHSPSMATLAPGHRARVNPYDLERLGVAAGGRVRVRNDRHTLVVNVSPDPGVPRGSISIAFNQGEEGAADLIDSTRPVTDVKVETVS